MWGELIGTVPGSQYSITWLQGASLEVLGQLPTRIACKIHPYYKRHLNDCQLLLPTVGLKSEAETTKAASTGYHSIVKLHLSNNGML